MKIDRIQDLLIDFKHIFSFNLEYNEIEKFYNLKLTLCEDLFEITGSFLILNFIGVADLSLYNFDTHFNQVLDLVIEKNMNGLEKIKYDIHQVDGDCLVFKCFNISAELISANNGAI